MFQCGMWARSKNLSLSFPTPHSLSLSYSLYSLVLSFSILPSILSLSRSRSRVTQLQTCGCCRLRSNMRRAIALIGCNRKIRDRNWMRKGWCMRLYKDYENAMCYHFLTIDKIVREGKGNNLYVCERKRESYQKIITRKKRNNKLHRISSQKRWNKCFVRQEKFHLVEY